MARRSRRPWQSNRGAVASVSAVTTVLAIAANTGAAEDQDFDGVDDSFEQFLIDMYRPILYYDSDQSYWPITVLEFVTNSKLEYPGEGTVVSLETLASDPLAALAAVVSDSGGTVSSNAGQTNTKTQFELNIEEYAQRGFQGPAPIGTYAKVSVLEAPVIYPTRESRPVGQVGDYVIQYWQLFGYNDGCTIPFYDGDHEGDWIYMDIFVDPTSLLIDEIVHHHHGSNCSVSIQPDEWPLPGNPPGSGVPVSYLEQNENEWWPHPSVDDCTVVAGFVDCAVHNSTGLNLRTQNVTNVGERFRPMPNVEAQLFVLFNGDWGGYGDGPDAPTYQRWIESVRSELFVTIAACGVGDLSPWCIDAEASVNAALSRAQGILSQTTTVEHIGINLDAGTHVLAGSGIISTPVVLNAPRGSATLTR